MGGSEIKFSNKHYIDMMVHLDILEDAIRNARMAGPGDSEMIRDDADKILDISNDYHRATRKYLSP